MLGQKEDAEKCVDIITLQFVFIVINTVAVVYLMK